MKQTKYLPEMVIGWIIAVAVVVGLTSCSSTRHSSAPSTRVVQGTSEWKYVELRGNKH
jgi:hypothetical protein